MFVIELIYKAELAEIDANMRAHMAFLKKHYAAGRFLIFFFAGTAGMV